ncbi:TPR-like protein [Coprinopsis marcescibilis]|uniref:TPR-like protein n=1 Tax=Coprinopsis marcescibilis TaxID=230819 RepID=A0A5C3L3Y1_COPMA|nr:TPR-like protein [Coprinopsis marcescibilis]
MQPDSQPSLSPYLAQRFQSLIWGCLDNDLVKSAVFHAERFYSINPRNHDARHLYATALLKAEQTYSALHLVNIPLDEQCTGCLEIKAKCCQALGRFRQAREALDATLRDSDYVSTASSSSRISKPFPEAAALRCRAGNVALKGNQPGKAQEHYLAALRLNPYTWEAVEGLCAIGKIPEIDKLIPPRPLPVKRGPPSEEHQPSQSSKGGPGPVTTGAGFFTPEAGTGGGGGNLFRNFKDISQPQPFRLEFPRDAVAPNDTSVLPDNSFQVHRTSRSQPATLGIPPPQISRPLSSADEAGPAQKRLRSTSRQPEVTTTASKPKSSNATATIKPSSDDPLKKPANPIRTNAALGKSNAQLNAPARRSNRLLSGSGTKQLHLSKFQPARRRQAASQARNKSIESDKDEEAVAGGEGADSTSPPGVQGAAALSPRSEGSPAASGWTAAQEQQAQEEYETELADHVVYELVRQFASAARRLALYDCRKCLEELEELPVCHKGSASALIMIGKVHYELQDYSSAERAFRSAREIEPYRLWDMEVYSTLLWHLQRNVELSYLAQELLNINPQSSQAWIAIGNLFSLQKDRTQALTCFRRASQLDPSCSYAFTLSGHETIDEDLDRSMTFFESALRVDARHYNAWYGLGTCYLRASKIRRAEYHYRKALDIHPNNAVILGCVAMTLERRKQFEPALVFYNKAIEASPENALVRYRRARMWVAMKRYQDAVQDLEHLRRTTPEEANVIFQLAKVYRLIGDEVKSAQALAVARDIAPKSVMKMKRLLETVRDDGDDKMDEG